jgi:hypothetical protein
VVVVLGQGTPAPKFGALTLQPEFPFRSESIKVNRRKRIRQTPRSQDGPNNPASAQEGNPVDRMRGLAGDALVGVCPVAHVKTRTARRRTRARPKRVRSRP